MQIHPHITLPPPYPNPPPPGPPSARHFSMVTPATVVPQYTWGQTDSGAQWGYEGQWWFDWQTNDERQERRWRVGVRGRPPIERVRNQRQWGRANKGANLKLLSLAAGWWLAGSSHWSQPSVYLWGCRGDIFHEYKSISDVKCIDLKKKKKKAFRIRFIFYLNVNICLFSQ